ncbi:lipopolysaccharide biosynthesis protein [Mediterraneibacter glycyrrhizinilyticus]|uniref:lipopolysaccharide biosynthesis protein n=1 Tax=Mediterraneibacter glycyrrhizinilyticus TaxID=342942 RepID=UPI0025A45DA5|nr:hypothetical protein [Mediterraneibacter glycyrrhizinilyticus]MDM8125534.1 hypothetical protein [Mediterraneibacter glycyrrhizinilyticus]
MNRTNKFMLNASASAVYQVLVMLIGMITPRLLLVAYGSEINGLVSSVTQFVSYFSLVQAGLSGASIYALYKPLAEKDEKRISSIVTATRNFYFRAGLVFVGLLTALALIYPLFVRTEQLEPVMVSALIFVIGFGSIIDMFLLAKYTALLSADQRNYVLSIGSTISTLLNFTIVVYMTSIRANIVLLKTVAITSVIARSIFLFVYSRKRYAYVNFKEKPDYSALSRRWNAMFLQILGIVQRGSPTVLLTFLAKLTEVSVYSVYNMVMTGLNGLLDVFISGLSASFGDIISRNEIRTLQKSYQDFECAYYGLITVVYSIGIGCIMPFIRIYTDGISDVNYLRPALGVLFMINAFLYNIKTPQGMLIMSAGLFKETQVQNVIQALLIIVPGIILIPKFGVLGILFAMILSNLYRDIDLILFIPKYVTKLSPWKTVKRIAYCVCVMILSTMTMSLLPENCQSFGNWIIYAGCCGIIAGIIWVVFVVIFDRPHIVALLKRIKRMLFKK